MDRCSYFIKGKALFGSFPTQTEVEILEKNGVVCFVDLTHNGERGTTAYTTKYRYIKYPITDRDVPRDWYSYSQFIIKVADQIRSLKGHDKIYVHCKGGHGRSGVVVASLLCYIYKMKPETSLKITSYCHNKRKEMRDKWRLLGSPQSKEQKKFIFRFFKPVFYDDLNDFNHFYFLSDSSPYSVRLGNTEFETVGEALQSINDITLRDRYELMRSKFLRHTEIRDNLVHTYLRPLLYNCPNSDLGYQEQNKHGHLLMRIRASLFS